MIARCHCVYIKIVDHFMQIVKGFCFFYGIFFTSTVFWQCENDLPKVASKKISSPS